MVEDDPITRWIPGVKAGDPEAARRLWQCYFEKLVRLARRKLEGHPRRMADEEDVALSAFKSFCLAAREGRFPDLSDRESLWRLLLMITVRKAVDLIRHDRRQKRRVRGESAILRGDADESGAFAEVMGEVPTPEFSAMVAEECTRLLEMLAEPGLKEIALAKLEGLSNEEIAEKRGCSLRTVGRQLHLIRRKWERKVVG